jgi:hypothetical protein
MVIARIAGLSPGTSPPPVRIAIVPFFRAMPFSMPCHIVIQQLVQPNLLWSRRYMQIAEM